MAGLDPRPFSLRHLVWLATGRSRAEWSRTVAVVAWAWAAAGGKQSLTAEQIAPGVFPDDEADTDSALTPAQLDAQSDAAWAAMHDYFRRGGGR